MAKNMVKVSSPMMTGSAAGATGRIEKSMGVGGTTPGSMGGMAKKPVTMGNTKVPGAMGGMSKNASGSKRKM